MAIISASREHVLEMLENPKENAYVVTNIVATCDQCGDDRQHTFNSASPVHEEQPGKFHVAGVDYVMQCPMGHRMHYSVGKVVAASQRSAVEPT
jgi:hypothetical protein